MLWFDFSPFRRTNCDAWRTIRCCILCTAHFLSSRSLSATIETWLELLFCLFRLLRQIDSEVWSWLWTTAIIFFSESICWNNRYYLRALPPASLQHSLSDIEWFLIDSAWRGETVRLVDSSIRQGGCPPTMLCLIRLKRTARSTAN